MEKYGLFAKDFTNQKVKLRFEVLDDDDYSARIQEKVFDMGGEWEHYPDSMATEVKVGSDIDYLYVNMTNGGITKDVNKIEGSNILGYEYVEAVIGDLDKVKGWKNNQS